MYAFLFEQHQKEEAHQAKSCVVQQDAETNAQSPCQATDQNTTKVEEDLEMEHRLSFSKTKVPTTLA